MMMILTSAGLQHTIKPQNHIITDTMNSNAVGIIIAGIDDNCALQYVDITDPVDLWKRLNSTYNRVTETTQSELRIQLSNCVMMEDEDVTNFIERLKTIQARMTSMQMKITDDELKHYLYVGLPIDYASVMAQIKVMGLKDIDTIIEHIKDHSVHLKRKGIMEGEVKEQANYIKGEAEVVKRKFGNGNGNGYGNRNRNVNGNSNSNGNGGNGIRCFNCGGMGHMQRE